VTTAQDETGLVTEEVEPGVERIISDGTGHGLEERHATYRYDMANVFVAPDGTVWLTTSFRDTDNDVDPPGALVWALGQSGTPQYPSARFCFPGVIDDMELDEEAPGVTCFDPATETETRYLTTTHINAVAAAPNSTYWAVGSFIAAASARPRPVPQGRVFLMSRHQRRR
jgi:hypothetical protein